MHALLCVSITIILVAILVVFNSNKKHKRTHEKLQIAIVSLIHKPIDFRNWLDHHFLHVDALFLRIEDTPELESTISTHPRKSDIFAAFTSNSDKTDNWHSLQNRQEAFCVSCIQRCRDKNIDWIIQNVDDDELLHVNGNIKQIIKGIEEKGKQAIFIPTVEAVYPSVNLSDSCFSTTNRFVECDRRTLCKSYYGGKSAAKICDTLRPYGPHQFQTNRWQGTNNKFVETTSQIKILHFESCSFWRWKKKYSNMHIKNKGIPDGFHFYNKSVQLMNKSEDEQIKYYKSQKIDSYYSGQTIDIFFHEQKNSNDMEEVLPIDNMTIFDGK